MKRLGLHSFALGLLALTLLPNCTRENLSDRDVRRDQIRIAADNKRRELQEVAGDYRGELVQESGSVWGATLRLEIKDIPENVEGFVDPVMVPTLSGYFRFYVDPDAMFEYIGFSLEKAEYDPKGKRLSLSAMNPTYKEMILDLIKDGNRLSGTWTAPTSAISGTAELSEHSTTASAGGEQTK